jgi:hypothetical protein
VKTGHIHLASLFIPLTSAKACNRASMHHDLQVSPLSFVPASILQKEGQKRRFVTHLPRMTDCAERSKESLGPMFPKAA